MTPLTRWKVLTGVLAIATGVLWLRSPAAPPAPVASAGRLPIVLARPLRVEASAAGLSTDDLVARILGARTVHDVEVLARKLGAVGDDSSVDAVMPLLSDRREGVPEAILYAFGAIGTEHAVAAIIEHTRDDREAVRTAAIDALGFSHTVVAERALVDLASRDGDPGRATAIAALGQIGSERAVTTLTQIASTGSSEAALGAIAALGETTSPAANAALRKLVDSPSAKVAAAALDGLTVDDQVVPMLVAVMGSGDRGVAGSAARALGRAGDAGLAVLRDSVRRGAPQTQAAAIDALAAVPGADGIRALGPILESGDLGPAKLVAEALGKVGGAEARELLIAGALSQRGRTTHALEQLVKLSGDDVDQALWTIAKEGTHHDRELALPHLIRSGHAEAIELVARTAVGGSDRERLGAMQMLAKAGTRDAIAKLVEAARATPDGLRDQVFAVIAGLKTSDPNVDKFLRDALASGHGDEAAAAAAALAGVGTVDARDALVAALHSGDKHVVTAATRALMQLRLGDAQWSALAAVAHDEPDLQASIATKLLAAGAPQGVRLAEELIAGSNSEAAARAMTALRHAGTPEAMRLMERGLTSSDPGVRAAAIESLQAVGATTAAEAAIRALHDSDPAVRVAAAQSLGEIGSDRARDALVEASRSSDADERRAAASSLGGIDDPVASRRLVELMSDADSDVAQEAINQAPDDPGVDRALLAVMRDTSVSASVRRRAMREYAGRGNELDTSTSAMLEGISSDPGAGEAPSEAAEGE